VKFPQPGVYIIAKHSYWSVKAASLLEVIYYDEESEEVEYLYDSDKPDRNPRCRELDAFEDMELIPRIGILEELF
jgi:hypothetical protein